MLPEDDVELFVDSEGNTWNRIWITTVLDHEKVVATVRWLTDEFREDLENAFGPIALHYKGGSMDGITA